MTGPPDPRGGPDDSASPDPRSLSEMRHDVIAALGRLADGTFARCDVCGVQISDRRLRLAPAADRCTDHLLHPAPHLDGDGRPEPDDDGNDDDRTHT